MKGAREYAALFATGQRGRLYLVSGHHARGATFQIYVLPSAEPIQGMPWCCADAVEVYGITGGQPGWTETYGWLHLGQWQIDFERLVIERRNELEAAGRKMAEAMQRGIDVAHQRKMALLATYK